jgi:hypothetical protein
MPHTQFKALETERTEPEPAEQAEILVAQIARLAAQLSVEDLYHVAATMIDLAYARELAAQ